MSENPVYKIFGRGEAICSNLVVCWREDNGCLGSEVSRYLIRALKMDPFGEIDPQDFFSLGGVVVENDVAKFQECKLYVSPAHSLMLMDSAVPRSEWFKFISTVLDIAANICRVEDIFTVGSMISMESHSNRRNLMASLNNSESKNVLRNCDISLDMDYETPAGQRPTMSTYLIWEAMHRNIRGVSLWVPVPFYMAGVRDWAACARLIKFLNVRLSLDMETGDLDKEEEDQNTAIAEVLDSKRDISEIMNKFNSASGITEAESNKLAAAIEERLGRGDCY